LEATRQAMEAARLVYESRQKLHDEGAIARNLLNESQGSYIQAQNQYQIALAHWNALQAVGRSEDLKAAEGQLTTAEGNYQAALAQLQYSEIRSPIDGVVADRPLNEGQMASSETPLFTVMDTSHLVARAFLPPSQAARLQVGDPASISLGTGQSSVPAKVTVVSPALDPNSTAVQAWVEAENPAGRLKPGSTVQVRMVAKSVSHALVVPAEAVFNASDGTTSVMVIGSDQRAHQTAVKTGIRDGDQVQILSGLRAGQRVATAGGYGLPDGTRVRVVQNSGAESPNSALGASVP
jgi:RND family efflux transporter MFP subunit